MSDQTDTSTIRPSPFSPDGTLVTDATGKQWKTGEWHPCSVIHPLPSFAIVAIHDLEVHRENGWARYWLVRAPRRPLPPIPKPKTQEELDEEAHTKAWIKANYPIGDKIAGAAFNEGFFAGITHARISKP